MQRTVLGAKIHRARVTDADIQYIGSISIDQDLMEASDILPHEKVQVVNITNGTRLETYAISAPAGSGKIQLNGAAARLVAVGDLVIIMSYVVVDDEQARGWEPRVVHVDADNRIVDIASAV